MQVKMCTTESRGIWCEQKNRKGFIIFKADGAFFFINSNIFQYMSRERAPSIQLVMEGLHEANAVTRDRTPY